MAIIGSVAGAIFVLGTNIMGGGIEPIAFGAFTGAFIGAAADMLVVNPIQAAWEDDATE